MMVQGTLILWQVFGMEWIRWRRSIQLLVDIGRSQYYDSYKQERNRYNVMFSGANSKYTDDYKSTDINPEQISIILENFRNNKVNR